MELLEILKGSETAIQYFCAATLLAYGISFLAPFHWFFDLFSHFKIQYFFGSLLTAFLCLISGQFILCGLMVVMAIKIMSDIQSVYSKNVTADKPAPNFSLIQYNKFYFNQAQEKIRDWLNTKEKEADILLINESLPEDIEAFKTLKDMFPYQYPEYSTERFHNNSILSKHPIDVTRFHPGEVEPVRQVYRIVLEKPGLEKIVIYAYHAPVPAGRSYSRRRNEGLKHIGRVIREENESNIILAGDWNMTVFSPHFKAILDASGLQNQKNGLWPRTTWPSFALFPFLKIPIDHVLFNGRIKFIGINKGPPLGSDHHPLVAKFYINPVNKVS